MLLKSGFDGFGDVGAEEFITLAVEVDVLRVLNLRGVRGDEGEEVVHGDAVLLHDAGGDFVFLGDGGRGCGAIFGIGWDGRGAGPDELRAGFFQARDDLFEAILVVGGLGGAVVDAEVEMDDVPMRRRLAGRDIAEPDIEFLQPIGGGPAILRRPMDIRFAGQSFAGGEGVAAGDRVTDEKDAGKLGIVLDIIPGRDATRAFSRL